MHRSEVRGTGATQHGGVVTLVLAAGVVLAVVVAGWWFLIRSEPASAPEIRTADTVPGGTLDGKWRIKPGDLLGSYVQYRVRQQLVGALESDATGRTSDITATLTVNGSTISDVKVDANLTTLVSDKQDRDKKIQQDGLQSNQFPTATFVLAEPIKLDSAPRKGEKVTADAIGDFTLHGVTKRVTFPLEGRWDGETVQVVGKIPIRFADYGITPPSIGGFVTVADKGRMEIQLFFLKS